MKLKKNTDENLGLEVNYFNDNGFSLVELIVVMAIIGVLTLMASMTLGSRSQEAELRAVQQDIRVLSDASENHLAQENKYPTLNGDVANADKLVQALGRKIKREDLKALDEVGLDKYVQSTKNELTEYVLATKGIYRGQVFYLGDVVNTNGEAFHGQVGGEDIISKPPIEYSHSELFAFISDIRNTKVSNKYHFTDEDMYEFKNAERQIGEGDDAEELQKQFNAIKRDIYVDLNSTELLAGDVKAGYYGLVEAKDLFTGEELAKAVGLVDGVIQNKITPWLKFTLDGKAIYKPMKSIRYAVSWDQIDSQGAVFGSKKVDDKNGNTYKVRLMRGATTNPSKYNDVDKGAIGSEWNKLMLPITVYAKGNKWSGGHINNVEENVSYWGIDFTDNDLGHNSNATGGRQWTQEVSGNNSSTRVLRGMDGVPSSLVGASVSSNSYYGWSPVLEMDLPNSGK